MAAFEETAAFCIKCDKQTVAKRAGTNHVLHAILSLLTMGFWLIIWLLSSIKFGDWYCVACKSKKLRI